MRPMVTISNLTGHLGVQGRWGGNAYNDFGPPAPPTGTTRGSGQPAGPGAWRSGLRGRHVKDEGHGDPELREQGLPEFERGEPCSVDSRRVLEERGKRVRGDRSIRPDSH